MNELLSNVEFNLEKKSRKEDSAIYKIKIKVPMSLGWIERMKFITETTHERVAYQLKHIKNEENFAFFEGEIELPTKAIYHYYFSFEANGHFIYLKSKNQENINSISRDEMWKLSVNFDVPRWTQGKIMYHIFVDRFYRGSKEPMKEMPNRSHKTWEEDISIGPDINGRWNTDFFGGDLKGVIEKLDYINSLGASIIYLSPIVLSQSNHRYDTADYFKIDPYAGTEEDLKKLCKKAHELGIKIILDAVFNHTGNDSKYFNQYGTYPEKGAFEGTDSKYFPFYRTHIEDGKVKFSYWWGIDTLPVCNGYSKEWQEYILGKNGVIEKWFSLGIDGLRLDVADELTDEFIEKINKIVEKYNGFIIGEVWENPIKDKRSFLESGNGMHTIMNYRFINALLRYYMYQEADYFKYIVNQIITEYPKETINSAMNFTSTHDISRALNLFICDKFNYHGKWYWDLLDNDNKNKKMQRDYKLTKEQYQKAKKIYASYIYTLAFFPGILSIFYGDEVGMQGLGNLANRRPYPWNKEDTDLLNLFRTIGKIRKKEKALETASIELLDANNDYLMFRRFTKNEEYLALMSRVDHEVKIVLPRYYDNTPILYNLNNSSKETLNSYGGLVLKKH